jgi:putative transposase
MLTSLRDQYIFSKIDGFFRVPLRPENYHKTAFRVKNRLHECKRMPMGFKNSPAVFQRIMDIVLEKEKDKICIVYVEDILVFGKNKQEHAENLNRVILKLVDAGLQANQDKCEFDKEEVEFLGFKLKKNSIVPIEQNVLGILQFQIPANIDETKRFLGLINYYRKLIPNCSAVAEPLIR